VKFSGGYLEINLRIDQFLEGFIIMAMGGARPIGHVTAFWLKLKGDRLGKKLAENTRNKEVLLALAKRFPDSREVHAAICLNPISARDDVLLASVEKLCEDKLRRLPYIKELMAKARKGPKPSESPTAEELTELAELVLNPLKMIREAVFRNKVIILSAEKTNKPKILRAMAENTLGEEGIVVSVKVKAARNEATPSDSVVALMSDPLISALLRRPSGERNINRPT